MTFSSPQEFRSQLLAEMTESILAHETRETRRLGCLEGVEICRRLGNLEEFEKAIIEWSNHIKTLQGKVPTEEFWQYRCATAQVEFFYERLKALNVLTVPNSVEVLSARAALHVQRMFFGDAPDAQRAPPTDDH